MITKQHILTWLAAYAAAVNANADELNRLDSALGDGDFGASMQRGVQAIQAKLPSVADKDIGTIFKTLGMTLVSSMGGTSGPLLGTLLMQMGNKAQGKTELSLGDWTDMLQAGVDGVKARGKAEVGDKTMLDAFVPALDALKEPHGDLATALRRSAEAAEFGRDNTAHLVAKKGRASYVGERGLGAIDPGAANAYLFISTLAEVVD
jgi:dihydroxyacetone kinase-like protein